MLEQNGRLFQGWTKHGKGLRIALCLGLLLLLAVLPIRMGVKGNAHIPGLGHMEEIAQNHWDEQLAKIAAATALAFGISGAVSVLEELHFSVVVASAAPFKALSGINGSIKSLGNSLLICTGLFILCATLMGMISFICFKLLFPAALIFRLLQEVHPELFACLGNLVRPMATGALLLWLFFPATALLSQYVQKSFLDERIAQEMRILATDKEKLDAVREGAQAKNDGDEAKAARPASEPGQSDAKRDAAPQNGGMLAKSMDALRKAGAFVGETAANVGAAVGEGIRDSGRAGGAGSVFKTGIGERIQGGIEAAVALAGDFVKRILHVVVLFMLTAIVIPVGVLVFFLAMFKALRAPAAARSA
ncbi:MAG: hypothetical protein LBH94_03150 [Deltaproteobacteria bacterium]|jgi:hypothetical protein|nr:hypothetical protein [Deltaproteobacteria bacterium]